MPRRDEPGPFAHRIGARIRELRLAQGMSIAMLADVTFISKGHISSLEHGLVAFPSRPAPWRARFHHALGSAAEVRACLDVADALGYVDRVDGALRDSLDRIAATLHRLVRR